MSDIRVRFAPSPTGFLHVGGLRTALYNYLFARAHGGTFVLRIEDTDRSRFVEEAEDELLESLRWAGIDWDEGPDKPDVVGDLDTGPFRQSERSDLYTRYARELVDAGHAYLAFDTEDELEAMRRDLTTDENPNPRYDFSTRERMRNSLTLAPEEVERLLASGTPYVVRLKVEPGREVGFDDIVRGRVTFASDSVDDQVLVKSDGMPTYHLANVVDDHLMRISHVIRGEEWLSSTPKHMLLYEAFGWDAPVMAHLPLILSPTGGKLSKRNAEKQGIPVSVRDYRASGYEPAALVNYLAMLGWNPGDDRELFSIDELVEAFTLERVGQAGIQFDLDKLKWYNEQHLRRRSPRDIAAGVAAEVEQRYGSVERERLETVVELMLERISFEREIAELDYFFEDPSSYDETAVKKRWKTDASDLLAAYGDRIRRMDEWTTERLETELRAVAEEREAGAGRIIHPARLAVSGVSHGPGVFELLHVVGRDAVLRRFDRAIERLG
ncbi:MAG: glutamate--tRNA ligase [Rhodothermales bacterium]|nr:glutamate--tRNA ligase [Rhodothermales bacterium]